MNVSPIADDITSATADPSTVLMPAVTFDLLTGFVFVAALVLACLVYRWTAPAPGSHVQTSKGERVMYAVGAAASVIVIGSYLVGGVRGFAYEGSAIKKPAPAAWLVLIGQETDPKQSE